MQTMAKAKTGTWAGLASVQALVQSVQRAMLMGKLKIAAVGLSFVGLIALGIGTFADDTRRDAHAGAEPKTGTAEKAVAVAKSTGPETVAAAKPRRRVDDEESRIEVIPVTGRALDQDGHIVAGATIYVNDANRRRKSDEDGLLATATAGPDGRFVARGVELRVWKPERNPLPTIEEGRFQVAGIAPGFGFTWHEFSSYRPAPRPPADDSKPRTNPAEVFYQGEPIQLDLAFGPPASVRGKIEDDLGRPLANAKVQVGFCDDPRKPDGGKIWNCTRVDPTDSVPRERRAFDSIHAIPAAMLSTRTGPDGAYRIDGLPREAQLMTLIDPGPEFDATLEVIATSRAAIAGTRSLGFDAQLDHTFAAVREVRFSVQYSDTKQPVENSTVRAQTNRVMVRSGSVGLSDDKGQATLRLRPGDYEYVGEPPFGLPIVQPGEL